MYFAQGAHIKLDVVDSTNNYAASLLRMSTPPEGTVITALQQTEGRGQRGANWDSLHQQNLLMSLICYPKNLSSKNQFILSQCFALGVADAIEEIAETDTWVKWPNDIIVGNKKIAGILIECSWAESGIQSAIVGMGINVNQTDFAFENATSLSRLMGQRFELEKVMHMILKHCEKHYVQLKANRFSQLNELYLSKLYRRNVDSQFIFQGEKINARIVDVESSGKLILVGENGNEFACDLKEISLIY
jgi:BirA family biotin operon repressor/biotin-[acetyl-CoA-carboxylase] ligase